jgi:aminoglycoside phosphotransferase (APT) family kinase protein
MHSPLEIAEALIEIATASAPLIAEAQSGRSLVHSDFNPKNILLRPSGDRWGLAAVLDWEYAFVGSPLFDLGNMLRFKEDLPAGFADRFPHAFAAAGGPLPDDWEPVSEALDLFALADLLTRRPDHPLSAKTVKAVRSRLASQG